MKHLRPHPCQALKVPQTLLMEADCRSLWQHQRTSPTPTPLWGVGSEWSPSGQYSYYLLQCLTELETISLVHINAFSVHTIFSCHLHAAQSNLFSFPLFFSLIIDITLLITFRKYYFIVFHFPKIKNNKILYVNLELCWVEYL